MAAQPAWQRGMVREARAAPELASFAMSAGPQHEDLEVHGSHLGLGHNPAVALIVADRLARRPAEWQPFRAPCWARRFLPAA